MPRWLQNRTTQSGSIGRLLTKKPTRGNSSPGCHSILAITSATLRDTLTDAKTLSAVTGILGSAGTVQKGCHVPNRR